ncbi:MAG: ParB/RepB/Spo0J family partition protein [Deltaproteobacteria bacterium]|nr:ParB/RepB/Spo0J family partition protein [Deltaproteobacteria bacterium]MCL5276975.1 ParB/RepB/Spo0J family partition protein [Deltaproteobacteria bacterium]
MEKKHNALGRGLSALIPVRTREPAVSGGYFLCPVSKISVNRQQPRKAFNEETIEGLAQSIKANGILQPLLVRPSGDGYQLIAGERRLRAAKKIGLKEVPVVIKDVDERDQLVMSLIENLQREDINPIDEAEGFRRLTDDFGLNQIDVARRVGKDRATVANTMRLLKLPEEIKAAIRDNGITPGHARAILALGTMEEQMKLFRKIRDEKLTVRSAESYTRQRSRRAAGTRGSGQPSEQSVQIGAMEEELRRRFASRVRINHHGTRGWIEIHYSSIDELDRILDVFRAKQ